MVLLKVRKCSRLSFSAVACKATVIESALNPCFLPVLLSASCLSFPPSLALVSSELLRVFVCILVVCSSAVFFLYVELT